MANSSRLLPNFHEVEAELGQNIIILRDIQDFICLQASPEEYVGLK